jgi:hypothetical protein
MSVASGANIVNDGLILKLDSFSRNSVAGDGVERLGGIQPSFNNWNGLVGTSVPYTSPYGNGCNLRITNNNGGGVNWWNSNYGTQPCSPSTQYVITARVRYTGGGVPNPNLFYVRQYNSGGAQTSEGGRYNSANQIPIGDTGYFFAWAYFTTDSTATSFLVHGYDYQNIEIWLEDIQCELAGLTDLSGFNNHHTLAGSINYNNRAFTTDGSTSGVVRAAALNGVSNNCTVVLYYRTTDTQELWVRGNQSNSIYLSASASNNYYHAGVGSPTNFVDLATVVRPDSPVNYRDGAYHMWEAKGVDFSGWTFFEWFLYPSAWQMAGQFANILVYNRTLTADESAQNFQAFRSRYGI